MALLAFVEFEHLFEIVMLDTKHDVRIHLDEAAIRIVGEALVLGALRKRLYGRVVEPEIEDSVHHARHRRAGAGTHGDEQRIFVVAE